MAMKPSRRKKNLGLRRIQTDADAEDESKDPTSTNGSILDETEAKTSGIEAADAEDPSTEPLATDLPEPKSTQEEPPGMLQQQEDKHDADRTVAAVAESYLQQVISQGVAGALLSWPEEFTAASHPEQWSVFSKFDADGNGTLDSEELFFALVSLAAPFA